MIFRQLFEPETSTYTYLFGCEATGRAVLVDPVLETMERDLAALRELGLKLAYTLDTHIHSDHVTAAGRLKKLTGSMIAFPAMERLPCADVGVEEGVPFSVGSLTFHPLFTPGHTDTHHSFLVDGRVLTGDALLIDACGRTDFQNGDAEALYCSIHEKLFTLPDETLVYPAHDYQQRRVSCIAQERDRNARIGGGKSLEEFIAIMSSLKLPRPKNIDAAIPANRRCGFSVAEHDEHVGPHWALSA